MKAILNDLIYWNQHHQYKTFNLVNNLIWLTLDITTEQL